MSDYKEHMAKHRRLAILRLLKEVGGTANDSVLYSQCASLGFAKATRTDVRDDLALFEKHSLITRNYHGGLVIASITERGVDVADGKVEVDGVEKPSLGRG